MSANPKDIKTPPASDTVNIEVDGRNNLAYGAMKGASAGCSRWQDWWTAGRPAPGNGPRQAPGRHGGGRAVPIRQSHLAERQALEKQQRAIYLHQQRMPVQNFGVPE